MQKHYQYIITGNVENTGFRFHAFMGASTLKINGEVKEEPGKVIIEAEGEETALLNFINWCRKGPSGSKIETFHSNEKDIVGYAEFRIL